MNILSENSILLQLPSELPKNRFLIFDAVRFSFEIIESNFKTLESRLLDVSDNPKKEVSITFHYAWSIIDYTNRINDLLSQLPWEKKDEILGDFYDLKEFRNTSQHLGGRKNVLLKKNTPFYGVLSWFYKDLETEKFHPFAMISGIARGPEFGWKVPDLTKSESVINNIVIQTVDGKKVIKADLNSIMSDLKKLCVELERRLENFCVEHNVEPKNWIKHQDILIKINHGENK